MSSTAPNPWLSTVRLSLSHQMAYKVNFLLLVIAPSLVFFLVKYNFWSSLYILSGKESLQGYSLETMLQYQAYVLLVTLLAQGYNNMALAEDIRLGRISSYLLYPFSFWKFHTGSFAAFQLLQIGTASLTLAVIFITELIPSPSLSSLAAGILLSTLSAVLWFSVQFCLGLLAFWLEETWVLRVMFIITAAFFSGSFLPLEFFPATLREIMIWLPFPYLTYEPVRAFMGTIDSLGRACTIVVVWISVIALIAGIMWRRGVKLYTAAGI